MLNLYKYAVGVLCILAFTACEKENNNQGLQNNVLKKSMGPHLVGEKIGFSYAMGAPNGSLSGAEVRASIAGAEGTGFEPYSWNTSPTGAEVPVEVVTGLNTEGFRSSASLIDTAAATLRYYYVVPEEARGKSVSFTFSATSSNGKTVSQSTQNFAISSMDMVRDIQVQEGGACYISISDMKAYTKEEVESGNLAASIDLVYLYREIDGVNFGHALVAPAAEAYLPEVNLPPGVTNSVKIEKQVNIRDQQLSDRQYAVFIDDIDFKELNIGKASNFVLHFQTDEGAWVETQDGKYRAFIYVNSVDEAARSMTISMKRLTIQ